MLISEELFLLLTNDEGKTEGWGTQRGYGLAGAVLADLIVAERITVDDAKDPRVSVVTRDSTGNPILDAALARVSEKEGKKLSSLVQDRKLDPAANIGAALAAQEIVGVQEKKMLGMVPARYPVLNGSPERAVRERLRVVIAGGQPTEAEATILSILQGLDVAHAVLRQEAGGLSKRQLKARINEVAQGASGTAVAKAVQALNTAILVAVIIPAATSAGSS